MEIELGILIFGTDRGGTAYAFEHDKQPATLIAVEFVELDRSSARRMGRTFLEFLEVLSATRNSGGE